MYVEVICTCSTTLPKPFLAFREHNEMSGECRGTRNDAADVCIGLIPRPLSLEWSENEIHLHLRMKIYCSTHLVHDLGKDK